MIERMKGILFVVILGVVIPALVMGLANNIRQGLVNDNTDNSEEISGEKISVMRDDETVDQMEINNYLTGVVLCEMPAEFEFEALKAQAVVARTYALRRSSGASKHEGAAVCLQSNCCQGYVDVSEYIADGGKETDVDKIRKAVTETDGLVLTYRDELIDATYFSCSGGMTEDAKAVWGNDVPYLQATLSPGEENASHYLDTVTLSLTEFAEKLELDAKQIRQEGIEDMDYTAGGGVSYISICGKKFKGTEFRKALELRSTAFMISLVGDTATITTKGFGHRVGMSQYGADAMAVGGSSFAEILKHYYNGVEIMDMR